MPPPLERSEDRGEAQPRKLDNLVEPGSHTADTYLVRWSSLFRGCAIMEAAAGGVPDRWLVRDDRALSG